VTATSTPAARRPARSCTDSTSDAGSGESGGDVCTITGVVLDILWFVVDDEVGNEMLRAAEDSIQDMDF
jgi:hypothetical protein